DGSPCDHACFHRGNFLRKTRPNRNEHPLISIRWLDGREVPLFTFPRPPSGGGRPGAPAPSASSSGRGGCVQHPEPTRSRHHPPLTPRGRRPMKALPHVPVALLALCCPPQTTRADAPAPDGLATAAPRAERRPPFAH